MVILYGGSFNPPTIAHYKISKYLIEKYKPKRFILIPVGNIYNKADLIGFKYRYDMLKIISEKLVNTSVSDFENQVTYKGTVTTLDYFQELFPNEILYYVIGADNLLTITKWMDYEKLLKCYRFIVLKRNNINCKKFINDNKLLNKYQDSFVLEDDFTQIAVSASDYRELNQDSVVLEEINDYIISKGLYNR